MAAKNLTINLMIDKSKDQVIFAESDKDFVDILLSFLTLPIATIVPLTDNQSIRCIDNLYSSIEGLHTEGLLSGETKSLLLKPSNAAADKCKNLMINVDDTLSRYFYICDRNCVFELLSTHPSTLCVCGKTMSRAVSPMPSSYMTSRDEDVFVRGMARFLISDDGMIMPVSTEGVVSLLTKHGIKDKKCLEKRDVDVNSSIVLLLLKQYFRSKTPFTDVFLAGQKYQHSPLKLKPTLTGPTLKSAKTSIKLMVNKKEKKVLYAVAKEDFVDLLLSFLTSPTGSAVKLLSGSTGVRCIDNLYKSAECISSIGYLKDTQAKEILLDPKLPKKVSLPNQVITVGESSVLERFYMCRRCDSLEVSRIPNVKCQCNAITNKRMRLADSKGETNGGFLKIAVYMVTDDLVVTKLSSLSVISGDLNSAEEGVTAELVAVDIGEMEALMLLQASVTSSTVLTDAFASRMGLE